MAEILHPGVTVLETNNGAAPIEGVGTSEAAFIGYLKRGSQEAMSITSWTEFVDRCAYGLDSAFVPNANLAYAVYGFFQNGGTKAKIVRAGKDMKAATYTYKKTGVDAIITVTAVEAGSFGNDVKVKLKTDASKPAIFTVSYKGKVVESYDVSLDASKDTFIEYVVNGASKFVEVKVVVPSPAIDPTDEDKEIALAGGSDGISGASDTELIAALAKLDGTSFNLLAIPESQSDAVNKAAYAYAEKRRATFILEGPADATKESILTEREKYGSENTAMCFPWIKVSDPLSRSRDKSRWLPACGHYAGLIARIDGTRGVHKAPAGIEAGIKGALDVKVKIEDNDQDLLNPKGINVIRLISGAGLVMWGARTISPNPNTKYLNVKRSLLYLASSMQEGTRWAVFEPNNKDLWGRLTASLGGFLRNEFSKGMFQGDKVEDAFFVKCDAELNTPDSIDAGFVKAQVGVAINRPGEFVVIELSQKSAGK